MIKPPPENMCAWCDEFVDEEMKIYAIGARLPDDVDMKEQEGKIIFLGFKDVEKKVPALVAKNDSEAKKHGHDLMFMTCSQSCYKKLKNTLDKEDDLFDVKKIS